MEKISSDFIIRQYRTGVAKYRHFTLNAGLWNSERYIIEQYFPSGGKVLDLGCGTGRTTFGLNQLGFTDIVGVDLCPEMIYAAHDLNRELGCKIDFRIGNATALELEDEQFDAVLFSFNGMMGIPGAAGRLKGLREIYRVLKPGGVFFFTCHDRDEDTGYEEFWAKEKETWANGRQRPELFDFGDLITPSQNEDCLIFIHIPDFKEISDQLKQAGFELQETFMRDQRFAEPVPVLSQSDNCRFWVVQKPAQPRTAEQAES